MPPVKGPKGSSKNGFESDREREKRSGFSKDNLGADQALQEPVQVSLASDPPKKTEDVELISEGALVPKQENWVRRGQAFVRQLEENRPPISTRVENSDEKGTPHDEFKKVGPDQRIKELNIRDQEIKQVFGSVNNALVKVEKNTVSLRGPDPMHAEVIRFKKWLIRFVSRPFERLRSILIKFKKGSSPRLVVLESESQPLHPNTRPKTPFKGSIILEELFSSLNREFDSIGPIHLNFSHEEYRKIAQDNRITFKLVLARSLKYAQPQMTLRWMNHFFGNDHEAKLIWIRLFGVTGSIPLLERFIELGDGLFNPKQKFWMYATLKELNKQPNPPLKLWDGESSVHPFVKRWVIADAKDVPKIEGEILAERKRQKKSWPKNSPFYPLHLDLAWGYLERGYEGVAFQFARPFLKDIHNDYEAARILDRIDPYWDRFILKQNDPNEGNPFR